MNTTLGTHATSTHYTTSGISYNTNIDYNNNQVQ